MTANLQPFREMAREWREDADEIDAFCDAAEAWLQDKHYYSREGIKKELVRTALIGEKKP